VANISASRYHLGVAADDLSAFDRFAQSWRAMALVALIALAAALFGAASVPVMDRDEARFAQATRQMIETGDYMHVRVQDAERNKKPVGIYWLQAASAWFFKPVAGPLNTIWPYRFVSALSAMFAAMATLWAGRALIGPRAALIGAALFASSMLLGFEGMTAKTDAALLACVTVMMGALAQLRLGAKRAKRLSLIFWGALGLGVLIKGPVAPVVAALSLATLGFWERRWVWMKPLAWWPALLLGALIVAPWFIAIAVATHGRVIGGIGADIAPKLVGGAEGHFAWPGYYLVLLPLLIFPAAYALPGAVRIAVRAFKARRDDVVYGALRFLLAWALPTFVLFEIAPTKLPHYTLPTYPAIALICGVSITTAMQERWRVTHAIGLALFALAGAGMVAAWSVGAALASSDETNAVARALPAATAGALIVVAGLVGIGFTRGLRWRLSAAIACALALSFGFRQIILPNAQGVFPSTAVAQALARNGLNARPLWIAGYGETSLVFLTRTDAHVTNSGDVGAHTMIGDAIVVSDDALPALQTALAPRHLTFTKARSGEIHALNLGNGHRITLYVGVAAAS
jgi:4-amino-4-deoxy-L-arabinose transferase-like glycosyltransferase